MDFIKLEEKMNKRRPALCLSRMMIIPILMLLLFSLTSCQYADFFQETIDDKYRTCYEVFVYSFYDSDDDGIGDLNGIKEKIDYIEDLGCNEIWLTPVCSASSYHKYDVVNYKDIDKEYGSIEDFEKLVNVCHKKEFV